MLVDAADSVCCDEHTRSAMLFVNASIYLSILLEAPIGGSHCILSIRVSRLAYIS